MEHMNRFETALFTALTSAVMVASIDLIIAISNFNQ